MIFKKHILITLIFFFGIQISHAQLWKRTRYEAIIITGTSSAFTDLGGANAPGTHFVKDIDFQTTRPLIGVGARYKYKENIAFKFSMIFGYLKSGDYLTTYLPRENRGIIARTPLFETSVQGEYSIVKERLGRRYTFSHFRGGRNFNIMFVNTYIFAGFGGIYFSPQVATYNGAKWTKPTGQGPTSKGENYSHFSMAFPFGVGFKYAINRKWKLGLEFGNRYTLTDYLDNHSDIYSKGNDSYFFFNINLIKRLRTARSGLPKF